MARSDRKARVVKGSSGGFARHVSPSVLTGGSDAPISSRGRLLFYAVLTVIIVGGIVAIALSR